ncbi:MAG: hypothetical protein WA892_12490 [Ornithinimicrobium sp.]
MTIIDCQTCPVRGQHCASCFVPVVARQWLGDEEASERERPAAGPTMSLTDAEWDAVDVFVGAGLVHALDVLDLVATSEVASTSWRQVG